MKTALNKILSILIVIFICFSVMSVSVFAADSTNTGDEMVHLTQRWLNQEYGDVEGFGTVTENGKTGWNTVYGLLRALQYELGITELANSFGATTTSLYEQNILSRNDGATDRKYAILQCALWCKGYNPGYNISEANGKVVIDEIFDSKVEQAVINLKKDAGFIEPDGVVTVNVMKALLSMDSFKLLSTYGGSEAIRAMQQELNRKYEKYTGLNPCDGIYGRNTNKALIYALQAEEKLPIGTANGNFGATTKLCCPEIPYEADTNAAKSYPGTEESGFYTEAEIIEFTKLLQYALLVNGFDTGTVDGVFDDELRQKLTEFQTAYALKVTGTVDKSTWMSLLTSSGDTSRSAVAADCATILTAEKAKTLYDNGYRYIGRYLTGTYNGGVSKAITKEEAEIIFAAGLRFFPIYQTSARTEAYFTETQGTEDAKLAVEAAEKLGIPENTVIYFAVDFDATASQINSTVLPYFEKVNEVMSKSIYKTGVYGTRNVCINTAAKGYTFSSFVSDMSTGFSGNLGFSLPSDWAFDQFATVSLGSGDGYIEIDKNGFSGRDCGVSELVEIHIHSYTSAVTKAATCGEKGIKTYTCSGCKHSYTEEISATGKHTGGTATCKDKAKCTVCGKAYGALSSAHKYSTANCIEKAKCTLCGKETGKLNSKKHKELKKLSAKAATYKSTGLTAGEKCTACGKITVAQKKTDKLTVGTVKGLKLSAVKLEKGTGSSLTLKWSNVKDAEKYEVYQYVSKKWKRIKRTSKTSFKVEKLKANKSYKFKVRAVVDGVKGEFSKTLTAKTVPLETSLTLKAGKKSLTASWKTVDNVTGYEVVYSTSKKFSKKTTKTVTIKKQKTKKTTIKNLKKGKKYYVKLRAYKTVGGKRIYGGYSSVKTVKVK